MARGVGRLLAPAVGPWAGSVERIPDVVWAPYQSLSAGPWLALLLGSLGALTVGVRVEVGARL